MDGGVYVPVDSGGVRWLRGDVYSAVGRVDVKRPVGAGVGSLFSVLQLGQNLESVSNVLPHSVQYIQLRLISFQ